MALTDSLISYWSLEEASGTRNDAHGTNHLTDNGTVTQTTGKVGNAAQFAAANSEYLNVASNSGLQAGDVDFTIAAWFFRNATGTTQVIAGKFLNPNIEWRLMHILSVTRVDFQVDVDGATGSSVLVSTPSSSVSSAAWHFAVAWHDSVANTINVQVDNGTVYSTAHSTGVFAGTAAFQISGRGGANELWDGLIDEVAFWKRVLTSDERTELYNGGSGRDYAYISGAVAADMVARTIEIGGQFGVTMLPTGGAGMVVLN